MTFRGSGRPSVSEGAGVGQHFHAAHRAASRTYIADVTSISLDGFIRFRSDRRSFTLRHRLLLPAPRVAAAALQPTCKMTNPGAGRRAPARSRLLDTPEG
jgi:hypothetical protein